MEFKYDGGGVGKGGTATLLVDDKEVAKGRVEKTVPGRFSADETLDTGQDTGSSVSDSYKSPFKFTGTITKTEIDLAPEKLSATDMENLRTTDLLMRIAE
jgi:arylsulfatase